MEEIEACIAAPNTVEAEIEAKELARIIEAFLDTLTTENRVIFMRRYWFSDSYKDIAEFMGLSEKNISVRLTRIQAELSKAQEATVNAEKFMNVVRRHTSFEELTPTLLREFVEKIVVHECSYDENKTRRQDIEIYYSFVGKVDLPE